MRNLNDALLQYAIESGVIAAEDADHTQIGAEEITVVTDETQTTLDEAVQDVADDVEKLAANDASAEKLVDAVESLEAFVGTLAGMRERGEALAGPAAKMYLMGVTASLEARQIPVQIFETAVVGMNESFESAQVADYSTEAEEKTEGLLTRLVNMLKAAAQAAFTYLKEFFLTIGKGALAIETAGKKLQRVGANIKGEKSDKKIKAKAYGALSIDGKVDAVKAVQEINGVYTSEIVKIDQSFHAGIAPIVAVLANPTPAAVVEAGKKAAGLVAESKDISLPGGAKVKYTVGDAEGLAKLTGAKFEVHASDAKPEGEVEPLSPQEIVSLGKELVEIAGQMRVGVKFSQKGLDGVNSVLKAADKAVAKTKDGNKEEIAAAREVIKAAIGVTKNVKGVIPAFSKYMGTVAKSAYSFGVASASAYGKKVEEKAEGADKADAGKDPALLK